MAFSDADAWLWWSEAHGDDLELIAAVSGVTLREAQRWKKARRLPAVAAAFVDQIANGRYAIGRLTAAGLRIRADVLKGAVGCAARKAVRKRATAEEFELEQWARKRDRRQCFHRRPPVDPHVMADYGADT